MTLTQAQAMAVRVAITTMHDDMQSADTDDPFDALLSAEYAARLAEVLRIIIDRHMKERGS